MSQVEPTTVRPRTTDSSVKPVSDQLTRLKRLYELSMLMSGDPVEEIYRPALNTYTYTAN